MNESNASFPLPDHCGPEKFAKLIIWLRSHARPSYLSQISQSGIRGLIELAFYLSLSPEEGRYPRLCLANEKESDFRLAIRFDNPIELKGIDDLKRLAPACST